MKDTSDRVKDMTLELMSSEEFLIHMVEDIKSDVDSYVSKKAECKKKKKNKFRLRQISRMVYE